MKTPWERINFNVPEGTIAKLKEVAKREGLPYQLYLRRLILRELVLNRRK